MRTALLAVLLVVLSAATALSQGAEAKCPVISISGPPGLTNPDDPMVFTAEIRGLDSSSNVSFAWEVSAGQITGPPNAVSIKVATAKELAGVSIAAKVTVKGLPENCSDNVTWSADIARHIYDPILEDYGHIPWRDERARLDNFQIQINHYPKSVAFIEIRIEAGETVETQKKHAIKILKFFKWRQKNFDTGQLRFAIQKGADEHRTRFTLHLEGAKLPECGEGCTLLNGKDLYR